MALFSYSDIQSMLPHRYPMLMVDAVLSLKPRQSIIAIKCVTANEASYARVPEGIRRQSSYPVSLILESFCQASIILWKQSGPALVNGEVLMFGVARDCVFEHQVFPGDTIEHRVALERAASDSVIFSGESWVADKRVARFGWLVAVSKPVESLERKSVCQGV